MSGILTKTQISAGGVAFRRQGEKIEIVLISVGEEKRWQLPKGLVGKDEALEATAVREVREEGGVETELLAPIDKVEYWYYSSSSGKRLRFHKFVYFYLLRYLAGEVNQHDAEVNEAVWMEIEEAVESLAFTTEKKVAKKAGEMISKLSDEG